jgi:hypothetical protein
VKWIVLFVTLLGLACQPAATPESGPPPDVAPPPGAAPPPVAAPEPESAGAGSEPVPAEGSAPEPAAAALPPEPPQIEVGESKFLGEGSVPDVEAFLEKMKEATAQCLVDHAEGAVRGSMRVQFLVRLSGRAEGVDVRSATGVSEAAQRCVRDAFKHKHVGTPTADPTGVAFTYTFE